jgi:hypothetical protein
MKVLAPLFIFALLSGCQKPIKYEELPEYSDMSAAKDAQEALTSP